jgi:hypothetical protein
MSITTKHKTGSSRLHYRTLRSMLSAAIVAIVVIVATFSLVGCVSPQFMRYPSLYNQFPAAENAAYGRQDPFPDPDIGPSTDSSPRGYERPRSTARQAAEQRLLQGVPVGPEGIPPGVPQGTRNNSQAVY